MTILAHLRKTALALPETEEGTHFGMVAFSVRGKSFVSVDKDGYVQLRLSGGELERARGAHPDGEVVEQRGTPIGFRLPLAGVNGKDLNALVRAAWAERAPKRLVAALAQPDPGELPAGIGRPATRALTEAGLNTLDRIAGRTEAELLALHGVGPKAVRVLREALAERGLTLKG